MTDILSIFIVCCLLSFLTEAGFCANISYAPLIKADQRGSDSSILVVSVVTHAVFSICLGIYTHAVPDRGTTTPRPQHVYN